MASYVCWSPSHCVTIALGVDAAVAYLIAALVVLAVPPKAGARAEGTAAWWIAGSALFVTYVLVSLLLRVRLRSAY